MSLIIEPILCNAGSMDNYAYLLTDQETSVSAIVDAAEEKAISQYCDKRRIKPKYILVTHHHQDHTNANIALKKKYNATVVCSALEHRQIPAADVILKDGDTFSVGKSIAQIILAAGHTLGHILWYFANDKALFTGDMLFNLTIGGIFEGTPEQMWQSLEKIKALPDDVLFYPGHEYTAMSLPYLLQQNTDAAKQYLAFLEQKQAQKEPFIGVTLGLEKQCNPYFHAKDENEFIQICRGY